MNSLPLGQAIKQKRLALGLTQEQLCEGICDIVTISRLENGRQEPSRSRLRALLQRLGLPDEHYYVLGTPKEQEIEALETEIVSLNVRYSRSLGEEKQRTRQFALERLHTLETLLQNDDGFSRQSILRSKILLGREDGPYSPQEQITMLTEAIRLTVPRFSLDSISGGLYSVEEVKLINHLGIAYSAAGERDTALSIFRQLLDYARDHFRNTSYAGQFVTLAAFHYARELGLAKHWEEAIAVCGEGWKCCVDYGHYLCLPDFIAVQAECRYFLGEPEESKKLYRKAYYLYLALGDENGQELVRQEAAERLQLMFED